MTYREYYDVLSETLFNDTNSAENLTILFRGEKGYLNEKGINAYTKLTFDLYILNAKRDEVLKLFREDTVDINDEVDQSLLVFTIYHFKSG